MRTRLRTKICPKMVLGHVLVLRHFREHDPCLLNCFFKQQIPSKVEFRSGSKTYIIKLQKYCVVLQSYFTNLKSNTLYTLNAKGNTLLDRWSKIIKTFSSCLSNFVSLISLRYCMLILHTINCKSPRSVISLIDWLLIGIKRTQFQGPWCSHLPIW